MHVGLIASVFVEEYLWVILSSGCTGDTKLNIEPFGQLAILFKTGRGPKGWGVKFCRSYTEDWEHTQMLVKSWKCCPKLLHFVSRREYKGHWRFPFPLRPSCPSFSSHNETWSGRFFFFFTVNCNIMRENMISACKHLLKYELWTAH